MELQQILSKMEADGWEIADDFKTAHGHFLQYFLETVEEALRQTRVITSAFYNYLNINNLILTKWKKTQYC